MKICSFDIGIKNLAYCILDQDSKINYWEVINLEASTETEITEKLIEIFDERDFLLECDIIVIEKQPSFNPKMKMLSHVLHCYFVLRGIVDRNITHSKIEKITFISPKNKLKVYTGPYVKVRAQTPYARTKRLGIEYCKYMITEEEECFKDLFKRTKKKDDLADCYMQGVYYLKFGIHNDPKDYKLPQGKVRIRKPTERQIKRGKYSLSNLKYFLNQWIKDNQILIQQNKDNLNEEYEKFLDKNKKIKNTILGYYKASDTPIQEMIRHLKN